MKLEVENQALQTSEAELTELIGHLRLKLTAANESIRRLKEQEAANNSTHEKVLTDLISLLTSYHCCTMVRHA